MEQNDPAQQALIKVESLKQMDETVKQFPLMVQPDLINFVKQVIEQNL